MNTTDLAIFIWSVIAGVSLLLLLQDAIIGSLEDTDHD